MHQQIYTRQSKKPLRKAQNILQGIFHIVNVWINRYLERPPKYLPILFIFITDRCNLQCSMCGVWKYGIQNRNANEMTTEEWKAVIHSAVKLRTKLIVITGGEPLLRLDLFDIIKYARERGIAVHLCSNGTILNPYNVDQLRRSGVNTVSISVDNLVPEIHESLRGEGTFEKAVQGIRLLREQAPSIRIGINYLITRKTFRNMVDMIPFAERLGVHQIKFAPIHTNLQHNRKPLEEFNNLIFRESDTEELEVEVKKLMQTIKNSKLQTTSRTFFTGIAALYKHPRKFRCFAGYVACAINPYGMVSPCFDIEGTVSVQDKPLEKIWKSSAFQKSRRLVQHCKSPCWDTSFTELSIRLTIRALFSEIIQTWDDLKFYTWSKNY